MGNKKLTLSVILITAFCGILNPFIKTESANQAYKGEYVQPVFNSSEEKLIPIGKSIGVTMNIDGVMVVGTCEILDENNKYSSPSQTAGIKCGDVIKSLDGKKISTVSEMNEILKNTKNQTISCIIERDKTVLTSQITPIKSQGENEYKIGAWVKDAASGIGTITYYNPKNKTFGALGHGITDSATGGIIDVESGNILKAQIAGIKRGEKGTPGELTGIFSETNGIYGYISENNRFGLFGTITNEDILKNCRDTISVLHKTDVKIGKAQILCNIEGENAELYDIEIQKLFANSEDSSKGMIIKICDERLIQKTGGIVQGMSGSPIIQNNRFAGAVTHVFVNDPTRGYGIFAEVMLDNKNS